MAIQVYLSGWEETTRWGRRCFVPELAVEGESFAVIDLRPDKAVADGLCLFARVDDGTGAVRPTQRPGRGALIPVGGARLGDRGDTLGPVARRLLGNRLGMDLSAIKNTKMFLAEILHVAPLLGKVNGGRALVVPTRERRLEAYLGGEKTHDIPAVAGGAVTDSFTYSNGNLSTVGSASWADVVGTVKVVSNHCENTAAFGFDVAKHKTAMTNGDHYAQAVASVLTGSSGAYNFMGVRIRQSNVADNAIHFEAGWAAGTSQSELNLMVFTAGTPTAIGNWISTDQVTGYPMPSRPFTLRVEGNGSSLSGYAVGTYGPLSVTDSTYSTNTYTGIMIYTEGGVTLVQVDNFEAGSLATAYTKSVAGGMTPAGAITKRPARSLSGGNTPSGVVRKRPARSLFSGNTPAGVVTKRPARSLSSSTASSGLVTKRPARSLFSGNTPSGVIVRRTSRSLTSAATPSGGVTKRTSRSLTSTTTPSGSLSYFRLLIRSLAGSLTPSGAVVKLTSRALTGGASPAGAVTRLTSKTFGGSVASSGALAAIRSFLRTLTASIGSSGGVVKKTARQLAGGGTPAGNVSKLTSRSLMSATTPSGALVKMASKVLSGSVGESGTVVKRVGKVLAGASTPAGGVIKRISRTLSGSTSTSGSLISQVVSGVFVPLLRFSRAIADRIFSRSSPDLTLSVSDTDDNQSRSDPS